MIDWNTRVARLEDFGNGLKVEPFLGRQHENIGERRHDFLDRHVLVFQGPFHGRGRVGVNDLFIDMNLQQFYHFAATVRSSQLFTQRKIETFAEWVGHGEEQVHDDAHDGCHGGSHLERVALTGRLRNNFSKNDNEKAVMCKKQAGSKQGESSEGDECG